MYTRSDDPKDFPFRNVLAVIVIIAVAAGVVTLVRYCWDLAQQHSTIGSPEVTKALETAATAQSVEEAAAERGYTATGDSITTVLFVITSEDENGTEQMSALNLAVLNETQSTAKLIQIPVDSYVTGKGITETFANWYTAGGIESVALRISSTCAVPVNHIVVMGAQGWESFMTIVSQGASALTSNATELLESISQSDMDVVTLTDIMTKAIDTGLSSASIEEAPTTEAGEEGSTYQMIDGDQVALMAGTFAE